jgi:hypothetical protein
MTQGAGDTRPFDAARLAVARQEFDAQARRFEQARARLQATIDKYRDGRPQRELLHESAFARLQARVETMPVIEQAKGILMAQHRCGPDEAFDLLRRASQRANIKVSVLAAQMVERIANPDPDGTDTTAKPAGSSGKPARSPGHGHRSTRQSGRV